MIVAIVGLGLAGAIAFERDSSRPGVAPIGPGGDALAYAPAERAEFEARAAAGESHAVYVNSPGGVLASARRTAKWRPQIERAAARAGVDPDLLEAVIYLESDGRPDAIATRDPESAAGLAQIVPSTATALLGMHVDLTKSLKLTAAIRRAASRARPGQIRRLEQQRARVDDRFDPARAIEGEGRYLAIAKRRFGSEDLAIESYHMGIGNLERVIRTYLGHGAGKGKIAGQVAANGLTYGQLFFGSSPLQHPKTWNLLAAFGDESSTYYWKVLAAANIMTLYRSDRARLARIARLQEQRSTQEEVFHPPDQTDTYADPGELQRGWVLGQLWPIPESSALNYTVSPGLGSHAPRLGQNPAIYRGLEPQALATLVYMSNLVHKIGGGKLIVTSAVRDGDYQALLAGSNPEATQSYSLHTTGWAFDIARRYESGREAAAFQFVLDRLRAENVIDYAVEPDAIHVTVNDAG